MTDKKAFWKIAWPIILSGLGQSGFSIIDGIVVGQILGTKGLASLAVGGAFFFVIMFLGIAASGIFSPLLASKKGEIDELASTFKHTLLFNFLIATAIVIICWFSRPLLFYIQKSDQILEVAYDYLTIRLFSAYGMMGFLSFKRLAEGLEKTQWVLWAVMIAAIFNVITNYCLMVGVGDWPGLGLVGTAIAMLLTGVVECLLLAYFLGREVPGIWKAVRKSSWKWQQQKFVSYLAIPTGVYGFLESGLFYASTFIASAVSIELSAAHFIVMHAMALLYRFLYAFSVATGVRIGVYWKENDIEKINTTWRYSLTVTAVFLLIASCIVLLLREQIVYLFAKPQHGNNVLHTASELIVWGTLLKWFDGIQMMNHSYLKGIQRPFPIFYHGVIAYLLIGLSLALQATTIIGIWQALAFAMCCNAGMSFRGVHKARNSLQLNR